MKVRLWTCLSALVVTAVVAPGAWAAKPAIEHIGEDDPFEVPAGEICPFPLQEDPNTTGRTATFSDGHTLTNLRGTVQLTNGLTGESVSFHLAFSIVDTPLPDGGLRETARGQSALFSFAGDVGGPGLFLTKGRVVDIFDATGSVTSTRVNGQRTDMCALLS